MKRPDKLRVYKDSKGEWRWSQVSGANGKIIGASTEGYKRRSACLSNLHRIIAEDLLVWNVDGKGWEAVRIMGRKRS